MISHVTYATYIALLSTHAALQLSQPQSPCSCAAEIFHFWLIRIHSNARNSISLHSVQCININNFTFNQENFIQVKGTAMGTRAAPNFANVYMGRLEEKFVYQTDQFGYIIDWVRFIDDIFLIWNGYNDPLTAFIEYLNGVVPSIKSAHEVSHNSVNFLDTKVIKDTRGNICTDVYQKPTDTHPYLHWTSANPPHLKYSIPYSQALRLRRICSSTDTLKQRIMEYSNFLSLVATRKEECWQKCGKYSP